MPATIALISRSTETISGYRSETPACGRARSASMLDAGVWEDRVAGFVLLGPDHDLALAVTEIVDAGPGDILELHGHQPRFPPLPFFAELDIPDDGLESVIADVIGNLVLIEALCALDRLSEHLQIGIGPRREIITERVDALAGSLLLVTVEKLHDAGEAQSRRRQPEIERDDAVQHRPQ